MKTNFFSFALLIGFVYMFQFSYEHPGVRTGSGEYSFYPANEKITLTYISDFGETTSKYLYNGESITATNESGKFKYRQLLLLKNDGVYVTETYQKIKLFLFFSKEAKYTYNRPVLRLPLPLVPGKSWSWDGIEYSDGDSNKVSVTGKIFNKEFITVPAGKFEAIKVESMIESSSTKNIITEWYAEEIGLVKATISVEGGGLMGMVRDIFGYGKINFELKEIKKN